MNPLDYAMSLIRAPFLQKLKDKTFQALIGTAFTCTTGAFAVWNTSAVATPDKIYATIGAFVAWSIVAQSFIKVDKAKDAAIF